MKDHIISCQFNNQKYEVPYRELGRWNAFMIALSRVVFDCGQTQIEFSDAFSRFKIQP